MHRQNRKISIAVRAIGITILFLCLFLDSPLAEPEQESSFGTIGTNDFIEYWSSYQLFSRGQNPYAPELIQPIQEKLGRKEDVPLMMWNPPWLLAMMSPILRLPFDSAARAWILINAFFLLGSVFLISTIPNTKKANFLPCLAAGVLFYPAWNCLYLGQVSLLMAFELAGTIWALERKRDILAGIFLLPLTIKPHLVYLVVIALAWWIIRTRRYLVAISFALWFIGLLCLTAHLGQASALWFWFEKLVNPTSEQKFISVMSWKVATLVGWTREVIAAALGTHVRWPVVVIPSASAISLLLYLIRKQKSMDWLEHLPPILCISLFTSPYGWVFDQSMLLIAAVALISHAFAITENRLQRLSVFSLLLGLQVLTVGMLYFGFDMHHHFFWFPLGLLCVWTWGKKLVEKT